VTRLVLIVLIKIYTPSVCPKQHDASATQLSESRQDELLIGLILLQHVSHDLTRKQPPIAHALLPFFRRVPASIDRRGRGDQAQ
jgi:hypothetical protein